MGLLAVLLTVACAPSAAPPAKPASAPAAQSPASVAAPAPPSTGGPGGPSTAPATPPSPIAVRVAYASPGAALAPLFIGYENGIFREQGLDVELFYLAGTRTDQGVISGDTPIGFGANVVTSRLGGAELVAVAGVVSRLPALLFARSGIATPQDLRGKTIVSTSAGSSNHTATLLTMRRYGLEAGQDYVMQTTAGVPEKFAMMLQGYADGTLLAPPDDLKGQEQGLVQIANVADLNIPIVYTAVGVTTTYARDHAEEVRRFLRGYVGAVALARRDFEAARGPMSKYSQTDDPAIVEHSYRYYRDIWGRPDFRVPSDAVASSLRVLDAPGADTAKPEDFIDNRFLDELERSGFLRQAAPFN